MPLCERDGVSKEISGSTGNDGDKFFLRILPSTSTMYPKSTVVVDIVHTANTL